MGCKKTLSIFFAFLMSFTLACSFFQNFGQPAIPQSALEGLKPGSARILGHLRFADWATDVSPSLYATVFEATLVQDGTKEIRVFLHDGDYSEYVGVLSDQLQLTGVETIFIDLGVESCVIGWVSPNTPGRLMYFHIERPQEDPAHWMEAVLESTIEKNVFIIPIPGSKHPELWRSIQMAAVQTRESLQRGADGNGSYYEVEKSYIPPLDVSDLYILIPIQQ